MNKFIRMALVCALVVAMVFCTAITAFAGSSTVYIGSPRIVKPVVQEDEATKAQKAMDAADLRATSKKITLNGKVAIKVTWEAVEDADGYEIFRSTKKFSGFGKKPFCTTVNTTYVNNKKLVAGNTYYYKVRAYRLVDGKKIYSDWSTKAWRTI